MGAEDMVAMAKESHGDKAELDISAFSKLYASTIAGTPDYLGKAFGYNTQGVDLNLGASKLGLYGSTNSRSDTFVDADSGSAEDLFPGYTFNDYNREDGDIYSEYLYLLNVFAPLRLGQPIAYLPQHRLYNHG